MTLVQGQSAPVAGTPLRLAFDAVVSPCNDTALCLPSAHPETQFRVQSGGGAFAPLELRRIGAEFRFEGFVDRYIVRVDRLTVQAPGEWVATVVVQRGLEL